MGLLAVGSLYVAIGIVLMLAPARRARKLLFVLGAGVCVRGIVTPFFGVDRAIAVLDWEAMQPTGILRVGAVVAIAIGGFIAFALSDGRSVHARNSYR